MGGRFVYVPSADIAENHSSDRVAMDSRKWLAIHLPCQNYLVVFDLAIGHRNHIVVDIAFLEICIDTQKLNIVCTVFDSTTVLDHLLQADASIASSPYGTFAPLC